MPTPPRYGFPPSLGFWALAVILATLLFASSAPSPLYVVYQREWGFSAITLTSVFAVYALVLLGALLVVGSVSDQLGRRPVLLVALAVEIAAMLAFAEADGIAWLFAARILQGLATGVAMGAISAALIDLQPASKPRLGALMSAVSPLTGLALGALATGLLVEYAPDPTRLVFWILAAAFVLALLAVVAIPEPVSRDGSSRRALRPRLAVPRQARAAFVAATPSLVAIWALSGLFLSLGGSLTAGVLGDPSHAAGGLPVFVLCAVSAVTSVYARGAPAQATARFGLVALIGGMALAVAALAVSSDELFLAGAAIVGLGFGPGYAGVLRALSALAPPDRRAAMMSSILVVCYLAFSVPAVAAGAAVAHLGLRETAEIYGGVLIALAALALPLSSRLDDAALTPA